MTPKLKDQIVFRTFGKKRWVDLAKCLKEESRTSTISLIRHLHEKGYERCYEMLTMLMEEFGRNDWLFVKKCYDYVKDGIEIIQLMEPIIKEHIRGRQWTDIFPYKVSQKQHHVYLP